MSPDSLETLIRTLLADPSRLPELALLLPEVAALDGVPQRPDYHAEGDVLVHTRLAVAALPESVEARVFWATLLHDIGKAWTTRLLDGIWRSYGHDEAGAEQVPGILTRLGRAELAEDVAWLVRHHQFHLAWSNLREGGALSLRQKRFCRHPLFPLLLEVCLADAAASHGSAKGDVLRRLAGLD
ncbi:HD domain-containing protein [Geoalkalibacter sp.]|uniref:HD domain-containing protein n=1 Tax=Geoalkalibacter sp. TaxID=3041440 RepID=UPI00272E4575|nr:HD domain-containing protein [Geoalkalibacter sp.]